MGAKLFTFVVIADTHVNQEEGKSSSDFAVNRLANARSRHVIHEINRLAPAFVLHLGDMVHPTPIHPAYGTAAGCFHALTKDLKCPMYLTPGNHDVGDKPGDWLPVPSVNDEYLALYQRHFGTSYYSFDAHECRIVVINAQLINSGLQYEAEQRSWLEQVLASGDGKRVFLCTHYPPYLFAPSEESHYDNIDEPGRAWLLAMLGRHKVEALFAGHVHNFWYHLHGETEIYLLPATSFVRLDYSELYRVEPGPERGRNDAPKLGFLLVDVHERGHVAYPIRTFGATLAPGETPGSNAIRLPPVHTKSIDRAPIGIDLRYSWAETVEVPASGALDEFARKAARNDYTLMALWEMGVRRLRVPIADLADPAIRDRIRVLTRMGHEFTVYSHGIPSGPTRDALVANSGLIANWEIITPSRGLIDILPQVRELKAAAGVKVRLSKLYRHEDAYHHGSRARHVIQHGFVLEEEPQIRELVALVDFRRVFDGCVFRVSREQFPIENVQAIARMMHALNAEGSAYVRIASDNPAQAMDDDLANANRVAETVVAGFACADVPIWLDTFNDVDRGYFPRTGLVDRRFNPRMAALVYANLHKAFEIYGRRISIVKACLTHSVRAVCMKVPKGLLLLLLPDKEIVLEVLPLDDIDAVAVDSGKWIDLVAGETSPLKISTSEQGGVRCLRMDSPHVCKAPALVYFSF